MLVVPNTGLSGLSHQWGRCLASNCLHCCCSSPVHSNWRREGLGVDGARPESRTKAEEELCTETARAPRGWAAGSPEPLSRRRTHLAPGSGLPSVSVLSSPSPGAAGRALLRTCVPPAATQDTRGRSSARVPCCSPRSHTVSWRAWPGGGACPASSSRWAARFGLENPTC